MLEYHKRNPPHYILRKTREKMILLLLQMKSFFDYFPANNILLNILQNAAIYLFCFANYSHPSKRYISILQDKSDTAKSRLYAIMQ